MSDVASSAHDCGECRFVPLCGGTVIEACCREHHAELTRWMDTVKNERYRMQVIMKSTPCPQTPEAARVTRLCLDLGFGRVMQLCEQLWNEKEVADGFPAGGAHAVYCCGIFLVPCPSRAHPTSCGVTCDWCCGAGRVTERVAQAIRQSEGTT